MLPHTPGNPEQHALIRWGPKSSRGGGGGLFVLMKKKKEHGNFHTFTSEENNYSDHAPWSVLSGFAFAFHFISFYQQGHDKKDQKAGCP